MYCTVEVWWCVQKDTILVSYQDFTYLQLWAWLALGQMGISLWWEFGLDILKKFTSLQFPFLFPFPSLVVCTPPTPMSSFYMLLAPSFCSSLMFTLVTHIAMLSLCMLIALACCSSLMFTLVTHIDASQSPSGSDALKGGKYIFGNILPKAWYWSGVILPNWLLFISCYHSSCLEGWKLIDF